MGSHRYIYTYKCKSINIYSSFTYKYQIMLILYFLIKFDDDFVDFPWYQNVQKTLKSVFHLDSFRSQQLAAINLTLSKQDAILIMPTGGGKSLCYQLPALIDQGTS